MFTNDIRESNSIPAQSYRERDDGKRHESRAELWTLKKTTLQGRLSDIILVIRITGNGGCRSHSSPPPV